MFGRKKREEEARIAAERKEARLTTSSVNDKLRAKIKELEVKLEAQRDDHNKVLRANSRGMTKKDESIEVLQEQIKVMEALENNRVEQQVTKIELDARDTILDAREAQYDSFEEELKTAKTEAEKLGEERYKTGYSDGLADGLRKIHEITAEDRKQAMQIAALAASSHTPEAASLVAEGIRSDMMALPTGPKKNAKK